MPFTNRLTEQEINTIADQVAAMLTASQLVAMAAAGAPAAGAGPVDLAAVKVQTDNLVVTPDGTGHLHLVFPTPFAHGLLTVAPIAGDYHDFTGTLAVATTPAPSRTSVWLVTTPATFTPIRVWYLALGW